MDNQSFETSAGDVIECQFAKDCDGDGLDDSFEYRFAVDYRGGDRGCLVDADCDDDGLEDKAEYDGGLVNETSGTFCLLLADCDDDGVGDALDAFPADSAEQLDTDSDGFGDNEDLCDAVASAENGDVDGDAIGDACDLVDGSAIDVHFGLVLGYDEASSQASLRFEWETPEPPVNGSSSYRDTDNRTNSELVSVAFYLVAQEGGENKTALIEGSDIENVSLDARSSYEVGSIVEGIYMVRVEFGIEGPGDGVSPNEYSSYIPGPDNESYIDSIGIGRDLDGDTFADVIDKDDDGDGVLDEMDNCPAGYA